MPGGEGTSSKTQAKEVNQGKTNCEEEDGPQEPKKIPCLGKLQEELTCSICLEICVRPCTTPCGHNFCRKCLRGALHYSIKCPKCREGLPLGFPLNINTVLWNTIQLLFPNVCQAPSSPPAQSPVNNISIESANLHTSQLEADLHANLTNLAAEGHESLDFLLSRLDLSDPYMQVELVNDAIRHQRHFAAPQMSTLPRGPGQGLVDNPGNSSLYQEMHWPPIRPRARVAEAQDVQFAARTRRLQQFSQLPYLTQVRASEARQPLLDVQPLYHPGMLRSHPDRRNGMNVRPGMPPLPGVVTASPTREPVNNFIHPLDRSNTFNQWTSPENQASTQTSTTSNSSGRWRPRHIQTRELVDSPRDSFGSPLSISPMSAEGTQRYFNDDEWREIAHSDSERDDSHNDTQSSMQSLGRDYATSIDSVQQLDAWMSSGLDAEEHGRIDLSEYQLIEGIDGPRIVPRRQRVRDENSRHQPSGFAHPVLWSDLSVQSEAELQSVLSLGRQGDDLTSYGWPFGQDRSYQSQVSSHGRESSWGGHSVPRHHNVPAASSAESDGSTLDLDPAMNDEWLAYPSYWAASPRGQVPRNRLVQHAALRPTPQRQMMVGRENRIAQETVPPRSDQVLPDDALDQLYNISHQLSYAVNSLNLRQPVDMDPSNAYSPSRGEQRLTEGGVADLGSRMEMPVEFRSRSHPESRHSFDEIDQREDVQLIEEQFQRAVRYACQLSGINSNYFNF